MGDRTVLLIAEDEPIIRMVMVECLEEGGFEVLQAANGDDARMILAERHADIAGIITDIRVGRGPNGWELARYARGVQADIGVIYVTGDSAAEWPAQGVPKSIMLQKPFAEAQMLTAISILLDEAG